MPPVICCPPDSAPYLTADHEASGTIMDAGGVELYSAPLKGTPSSGIILCSDVWGWNSGRTRAIADSLCDAGYLTVVPKLLSPPKDGGTDGDALPPGGAFDLEWIKGFPWPVQQPKMEAAIEYLKKQSVRKICVVGFCYGGHPACWASRTWGTDITCGVVCHPSIALEDGAFGGDTLELMRGVQAPFFIAPAGNDLPQYAPDSDFAKALAASARGAECVVKPFPEMTHGWVPRGDVSDEKVARDVEAVMEDIFAFLAKHMS